MGTPAFHIENDTVRSDTKLDATHDTGPPQTPLLPLQSPDSSLAPRELSTDTASIIFEPPYDPPEIRTHDLDSDIALQHTDDGLRDGAPHPILTESPVQYKNDYGYLGAGGYGPTFDSDTRSLLSAKHFDHHESRKFLFKTGAYRFLITLGFSLAIGLCLKAYEGFTEPLIMSTVQVRYFNAIMLGFSLGLGLNLASSLKKYAVVLRWYLLTRRYVSLEVFDLILGLETLTNVGKLMVISLPGIRKVKILKNLPWFRHARDDGTKYTWVACLVWILINIAAQVLVAVLSLFWPVGPSDAIPLMTYGNVSVANLQQWSLDRGDADWYPNTTSMDAASIAGMEAIVYPEFQLNEKSKTDLSSLPGTPLYHDNDTARYEYRFYNRNPAHQFENYIVSSRSVQASATCQQLRICSDPGIYTDDNGTDWQYIMATEGKDEDCDYVWIPDYTTGGCLNWIGWAWEGCGPRCTNLTIYQEKTYDNTTIAESTLFRCNSTVHEVKGETAEFTNLSEEDKKYLYGSDEFARIAAGSIAWTGWWPSNYGDRQIKSYLRGSKWSPNRIVSVRDVEDLLARYTIGAIAAFDDHGLRYEVADQHAVPTPGQQLNVDWAYVLGLLGGICFIQLAALICLLGFANKSVVRDESFLSMAMLLKPVMDRIPGKTGMNMSGEEIQNHPKLLWKKIRYDYREGKNGEPNQVDIFFQGKDELESRRSWTPGLYN